jgi:putative transposase
MTTCAEGPPGPPRQMRDVPGTRKVRLQLNRKGIAVAHCTVERLKRADGPAGAVRGKVESTTITDPAAERARDLVNGNLAPAAPDRLWVADMTTCRPGRGGEGHVRD